ncbi:VP91 capsid [Pieris rapae granulovirus Wuhan]|uniref:VP91 capsid n=1 Tax=Pieris rapae granulovirus Wuhan TaxID=2848030 RepID=D2J4Q2_9BBAC|nr:VP91 capsid [Betabaculovirus arrapae]ACZ63571.1 VP91 capsid [Betabaculovirus arrapae]UOS85758.1 VP91 capsid [Pieris rapae granulovirus]
MLSVSAVLLIIFLVAIVFIFYNNFVVTDFDNSSFSARLNVLKEYLRAGENNSLPDVLGYVSHINKDLYKVTYFDTKTLKNVKEETHNETQEEFNFVRQSYDKVNVFNNDKTASVGFVSEDASKFIAYADDGPVVMDCGDGVFDGNQCIETPICNAPNTNIPLTENRLNRLVFNRFAAQQKPVSEDDTNHHPTAYIRCDSNRVPHIEECMNGETFQSDRCKYNPVVTTNGQGLIISANIPKISNSNKYKKYITKTYKKQYEAKTKNFDNSEFERDTEFIEQNLKDENISNKLSFTPSINKTLVKNRKFVYGKSNKLTKIVEIVDDHAMDSLNIVDNYTKFARPTQTQHKQHFVIPVNCVYPFDASPCIENGVGHTFTSNKIASTQFFECLDGNNLFLHSCNSVMYLDGKFLCDHNKDCAQFNDGSGILINTIRTDNIIFNTGKSVCVDNKITKILNCNTENIIPNKTFDHPLKLSFSLNIPRQIYDEETDACIDYDVKKVNIINDNFIIDIDGYEEFLTSMVGRVSKINTEHKYMNSNRISDFVTYSRDVGEICLDPKNSNIIDCGDGIVADIFDNTKYNLCDNGTLIKKVSLENDEFVENKKIKRIDGYMGECRYKDNEDYFDVPHRTVGSYKCFFTIPTIIDSTISD